MAQARYIPDPIIFSILSRLPAKSVLRFSTVSQSWNGMIKTSDFLSAHHHHHQIYNNNKECSLIYMSDDKFAMQQVCTLVQQQTSNNLVFPLRNAAVYSVLGVCEGLICLKSSPLLYIWNPVTKVLKTVRPSANSPAAKSTKSSVMVFGFGFNRQKNDYRIVKIVSFSRPINEVDIYSLSTNSWRRLESSSYKQLQAFGCWISSNSAVFIKGSIYWLAGPYNQPGAILRFDVEEEIFEVVVLPPLEKVVRMPELAVVNGFLVLFEVRRRDLHVWAHILNNGVWSSQSVVLPKEYKRNKRTLMTSKGGHIILEGIRDDRLFACDCYCDGNNLTFKFRDLEIHRPRWRGNFHLVPVVESLLWLDQHDNKDLAKKRKRVQY